MTIEFIEVPAGPVALGSREHTVRAFINTYGEDWTDFFARELPRHQIEVPAFRLAKTPVTNAQYRAFVAVGGYTDRRWWTPGGWAWQSSIRRGEPDYWHDERFIGDDKPVVGVSWFEALAFATWAGARLPSEAEWERAAKADTNHLYPWGSRWDASRLHSGAGDVGTYARGTARVGLYSPAGDGPFGHQDLLGQVWEWCSSLYREYPYNPGFNTGDFAAREDLHDPGRRVLRGGNWSDGRYCARTTCRYHYPAGFTDISVGFRLAQDLTPSPPVPSAPPYELLIYGRSTFCPDLVKIKRYLFARGVAYRQVNVDEERHSAQALESLISSRTVPTAVITTPGSLLPVTTPAPLPEGQEPRNFDRETLVQEPDEQTLARWIERYQIPHSAAG
ncbi:MAG TPA: SUMF1/EgtB/PvdO family nonheme iron enzyme [Herpetosiphonaceae bacterium]